MLVDTIRSQLLRLQVHSVNLNVSSEDDCLVALQGSVLQYWNLPGSLDGSWLLAQLQSFRDAAGPEAVMRQLVAAYFKTTKASETRTQLRLFDPPSQVTAMGPTTDENNR